MTRHPDDDMVANPSVDQFKPKAQPHVDDLKPTVVLDLASAQRVADCKLQTCRSLTAATSVVVGALSAAGSNLQRTLNETLNGPTGLEAALAMEDLAIQDAARVLFGACGGFGDSLISLAAALSGEILQPLQALERAVVADREQRAGQLEEMRRQHQTCASKLTESLRRKNNLEKELRTALADCDSQKHQGSSRFSLFGKATAGAGGETRLQQAMALQTKAVEEYGIWEEQTQAVSLNAQMGNEALSAVLGHVDLAVKQTFEKSLLGCVEAWKGVASDIAADIDRLFARSVQLSTSAQALSTRSGSRPTWAVVAISPGERNTPFPKQGPRLEEAVVATVSSQVVAAVEHAPSPLRNKRQDFESMPSTTGCVQREIELVDNIGDTSNAFVAEKSAFEELRRAQNEDHETREQKLREREVVAQRLQLELERCVELRKEQLSSLEPEQQAELHNHLQLEVQRRRSLAMAHARQVADLQRHERGTPSQRFSLADGPLEEDEQVEDREDEPDDVWDMDWTVARSSSGALLGPADHATAGTPPRQRSRSPAGNDWQAHATTTQEWDTLRQKLAQKRHLAEAHNGEDHTESRRVAPEKKSMPGVHPDIAAKLEARRRVVDAMETEMLNSAS